VDGRGLECRALKRRATPPATSGDGEAEAGSEPAITVCMASVVNVFPEGATSDETGPVFASRPVARRRRLHPRILPEHDAFQAVLHDDEVATFYLRMIQKALHHMCVTSTVGRSLEVKVAPCPERSAQALFQLIQDKFDAEVTNDDDAKLNYLTYKIELSSIDEIKEMCGFQYRWDTGWENMRMTRGNCLTLIPPPLMILFRRSRNRANVCPKELSIVATAFRIHPLRLQLNCGTELRTSVDLVYLLEKDANASMLEWSKYPRAPSLSDRWIAWAHSPAVDSVSVDEVV